MAFVPGELPLFAFLVGLDALGGDEDGGMFDAARIALVVIGESRKPTFVTGLEVDVLRELHPPLSAESFVPTRHNRGVSR